MKKYYLVQELLHPDLRKTAEFHGLAFLTVMDGEISHEAGDRIITGITEFVDGNLGIKKEAICAYEIFPVIEKQFNFIKSGYEDKLRNETNSRRPHSRIKSS